MKTVLGKSKETTPGRLIPELFSQGQDAIDARCYQLQKLVPPSKTWEDCKASELYNSGRVCVVNKKDHVKYRMHLTGIKRITRSEILADS